MFSTLKLFAGVVLGLMLTVGAHAQTAVELSLAKHADWSLLQKGIVALECKPYNMRSLTCAVTLDSLEKNGVYFLTHFRLVDDDAKRYLDHGLFVMANKSDRSITTAFNGSTLPRNDAVAAVNALFKDANRHVAQVYEQEAKRSKNKASYD